MVGPAGSGNPYRPGTGRTPPLLAGREAELRFAERRLAEFAEGAVPAQGVLLYGPRGNGKTVLLDRIATRARHYGIRAENLSVAALRDRKLILAELRERAGQSGARVTGVQVGPLGASSERGPRPQDFFRLLCGWVEASPSPLLILLDEAQRIEPEAGAAFFDAVQRGARQDQTLLLIVAGTPDTPRRLRECGTFLERGFTRFRIGRLRREASIAALAEPARAAGRPMSPGAQERLRNASQDYPYFIQLLGSAAWEAAGGEPVISDTAALEGIEETRPQLLDFYGQRLAEAEDRGLADTLLPLAELFAANDAGVGNAALREVLERQSRALDGQGSWTWLRARLLALGILWENEPGSWEMGIPSFGTYLLDRAAPIGRSNPLQ